MTAFYFDKIENFLVTYSENHKKYWDLDNDKRDELPEYKILTSEKIFTISDNNNPINIKKRITLYSISLIQYKYRNEV